MDFLRDIGRRLLMVALFTVLFAGGLYLLDTVRQSPVSLTELQNMLDWRQQVCRRLHDRVLQCRKELAAIPFFRADLRVLKNAEISSLEMMYDEALREYRTARQTLEKARSSMKAKTEIFRTKYLVSALLTGIFALVILPFCLKLLMYCIIGPLVEKLPPVRLDKPDPAGPEIGFVPGETALDVELAPGAPLWLRSGDWGKRRTGVSARTRLMWSWRYPLITISAGLCELVEFTAEPGKRAVVTVTSPEPDVFIGRIDLNGGSVVIRPRFLAGFSGEVQISTRWNFHLHNIFSCRVRQIVLSGTGTLLIAGEWGVDAARPENGQEWRMEENLLLAYSSDAEYSLCRTETFWHYFRGKTALFDRRMEKGIFFTRHNSSTVFRPGGSLPERIANALLNSIGGLLGF